MKNYTTRKTFERLQQACGLRGISVERFKDHGKPIILTAPNGKSSPFFTVAEAWFGFENEDKFKSLPVLPIKLYQPAYLDQTQPIVITRSRGGTAECKVVLSEVRIPDLFNYGKTEQDKAVLECWRIAHDLRKEVEARALRDGLLAALESVASHAKRYRAAEIAFNKSPTIARKQDVSNYGHDFDLAIASFECIRKAKEVA